jgi:tRNA-dihydrouridine synthase A
VHAGAFGACLMRSPQRVADCVAAMRAVVRVPVTVKMRIGVAEGTGAAARERAQQFDAHDEAALHDFISAIAAAGCGVIIVHARKAVLGGLSPAENREIPPLRHDVVRAIKQQFPGLQVILNGGLRDAAESRAALDWCDGVMLGREAYHRPYLLWELQQTLVDAGFVRPAEADLLARMTRYADSELEQGESLSSIVRHMLGLYAGRPGAREFRRVLSEGARAANANSTLLLQAAGQLPGQGGFTTLPGR